MTKRALKFVVSTAIAALATSVEAATVSVSTGLPRITYAGSRTAGLPQFDPALGTLNAISLDFNPIVSGTVFGTASGSPNAPNGWAFEFSGSATLSGTGFSNVARPFFFNGSGLVNQPGAPVFNAIPPTTLTGPLTLVTSNLTSYIGTGTVPLTLSANFFTDLFFSRGGSQGSSRELGMIVTATYDYTPIPEPSSSLLVVALVSLSALRRSRHHPSPVVTQR